MKMVFGELVHGLKYFVPFTVDGRLPIIVPTNQIITLRIMREAHQFSHSGHDGTLSRFWMEGFWTFRAGQLAKSVKNNCIPCRKLLKKPLFQPMGEIPFERMTQLVAWGYCQMDLFGPFNCRGDVNPRTNKKTWGMVIEDTNSGAVHLDIVQDYSTTAVLASLRRFGSLRGWPSIICSDPGSQLESASSKLQTWWQEMGDSLQSFAADKGFEWKISPPDSPWRQGKAEKRIGLVKKLLRLAVGDTRLSPVEFQTSLFEIANISNERPIGVSKPREDGTYELLTPNQLLTGRSSNSLPDDTILTENLPMSSRYRVVQHVTNSFWQKWSRVAAPGLITRQKWHHSSRNLKPGDLVLILDSNQLKGKYKIGIVEDIVLSADGFVRSAMVGYNIVQVGDKLEKRVRHVTVHRSVQRLCLIMPVEEQDCSLKVVEDGSEVKIYESIDNYNTDD